MREILFRGKQVNDGMWIQGYLFQCWGRAYILWGMTNDTPTMHEVNPETVGQFISLTDKNDTKIFEGDIVKSITHFYGESKERVTVVKFNEVENDSFGEPFTVGYSLLGSEWEIIGNIHDNPELLT